MKLVELAREAVINSPKTICEKIAGIVMEEASNGGNYISYYLGDYPETDYIVEYFKKEGFEVRTTGSGEDFIEIIW